MAKIIKINNCLAGVRACYSSLSTSYNVFKFESYTECAYLNPAAPLVLCQGINFVLPENGGMINPVAAFVSALPGGNRNNNGNFNNLGENGNFWSSTENNSSNAWNRNLNYNNSEVNRNNNNKTNGRSVRCVRHLKNSYHGVAASAAIPF